MCSKCEQLKYNNQLKKVLDEKTKQHTNYKFYSSLQLVEKLGEKNNIINKTKLEHMIICFILAASVKLLLAKAIIVYN